MTRLQAIASLIQYAELVDAEYGPSTDSRDDAVAALHTLGVTDGEINAAERKAARRA